jgi:hypothetical protein
MRRDCLSLVLDLFAATCHASCRQVGVNQDEEINPLSSSGHEKIPAYTDVIREYCGGR